MLIECLVCAVALGYLLGGSLTKISLSRLRFRPLFLCSIALELVLCTDWFSAFSGGSRGFAATMAAVSWLAMLIFAVLNRRFRPLWAVGAGYLLNLTVLLANGGLMPLGDFATAFSSLGPSGCFRAVLSAPALPALGDVVAVRGIWDYALSAGDLLILLGMMAAIIKLMSGSRAKISFVTQSRSGAAFDMDAPAARAESVDSGV